MRGAAVASSTYRDWPALRRVHGASQAELARRPRVRGSKLRSTFTPCTSMLAILFPSASVGTERNWPPAVPALRVVRPAAGFG